MRAFFTLFILVISLFFVSGIKVISSNGTITSYFRTDAFVGNKSPIIPFIAPVSFGGSNVAQLESCDGIPEYVSESIWKFKANHSKKNNEILSQIYFQK